MKSHMTLKKLGDFIRYSKNFDRKGTNDKTSKKDVNIQEGTLHQTKESFTVDSLRLKMDAWVAKEKEKKKRNLYTADEIKKAAIEEYSGPLCPYCGSRSVIKTAKEHRGVEANYCYWVCPTCKNVSVTTSSRSYFPSGTLANAEMRRMRGEVQGLLKEIKKELGNDRFALSEWIQDTVGVYPERAWVGQLSKAELIKLAKETQKHYYEQQYGYIFSKAKLK